MKLTLETASTVASNLIKIAYDKAMDATNLTDFMTILNSELPENIEAGQSGSHVWISQKSDGKRLAIVNI